MMVCSFEETINYPDGSYRYSKCINKADILIINDPCYGLCYACAYRKLQAENKWLKEGAKRAYLAIEVMASDKFTGSIKLPNGQEYNHGGMWELLFNGPA